MYYCIYTNQPDCDEVCCNPHLGDCTGCNASITANDSTDIAGKPYCLACTDAYIFVLNTETSK